MVSLSIFLRYGRTVSIAYSDMKEAVESFDKIYASLQNTEIGSQEKVMVGKTLNADEEVTSAYAFRIKDIISIDMSEVPETTE
jgi:hypothetical protein